MHTIFEKLKLLNAQLSNLLLINMTLDPCYNLMLGGDGGGCNADADSP